MTLRHATTDQPIAQPPREPDEATVRIESIADGRSYVLHVGMDSLVLSGFNAWRVVGMLAFMIGIPLPAKVKKAIRLL